MNFFLKVFFIFLALFFLWQGIAKARKEISRRLAILKASKQQFSKFSQPTPRPEDTEEEKEDFINFANDTLPKNADFKEYKIFIKQFPPEAEYPNFTQWFNKKLHKQTLKN